MEWIELDGAAGGGQLLRTALTLSLCTGTAFEMRNIRAKRARPGLMRQHLTAVTAAAAIGGARVEAVRLGDTVLRFEPGAVAPGDYQFSIGTAGSATLVLQTLLPALWSCERPSRIVIEGGTHNPLAPSADFLAETYLPAVRCMGVQAELTLERYGFYPAGGGRLCLDVAPGARLAPCAFESRGELSLSATAVLSAVHASVGHRELNVLAQRFGLPPEAQRLQQARPALGPGNVLLLRASDGDRTQVFAGYGERGLSAETVAERLANEVAVYLDSGAAVDEHLSDQLLLPMALAGGGSFTTTAPSDHLRTNAALIEKFLPVEIDWTQLGEKRWRVEVRP